MKEYQEIKNGLKKSDFLHKEIMASQETVQRLRPLWDKAFERFYCKENGLFYEFVTDCMSKAWENLPAVSEIEKMYPNPCGWGTGMEDSVMNGAAAVDALISACCIGDENLNKITSELVCGILKCTEVSENCGFVARSISPYDNKSHYIESSRDQYTHFVYSLLRYYFSDLSDEDTKERIRKALVSVAEKCKREVTPENDYNMLREDGSIGKVNKMWGNIAAHERMRMPMIYLAAYKASEKEEYLLLYRQYRDEALEKSLDYNEKTSRLYCALQMMCSLRLVYEYDEDEKFRNRLLPLMNRLAEYGEEKAVNNSVEFSKALYRDKLDYAFKPWRTVNMFDGGEYNGYRYLNPGQSELKENSAFYPVREVGEGALLAAMCPHRRVSDEVLLALLRMADAVDVEKQSSVYALLYLPCAYAACLENRMILRKECRHEK